MPQQVENATIVMLDRICEADIGRKLRVAGRCGLITFVPRLTLQRGRQIQDAHI
jgi:hypothetical protein